MRIVEVDWYVGIGPAAYAHVTVSPGHHQPDERWEIRRTTGRWTLALQLQPLCA